MFRSPEETAVLQKHKRQQLLKMFNEALSEVNKLELRTLDIYVTARFWENFVFDITVYQRGNTNKTLSIYDFWEIEFSQQLVNNFIAAIKTDDFEKVLAVETRWLNLPRCRKVT